MKLIPKIFKEYDIRGHFPKEINENDAYFLGVAFAKAAKVKRIVVGRDARQESEKIFWPFVAGLSQGGMKVASLGVCSTPELFFAVGNEPYPAGCMVTASHSPQGQSGFKFCDGKGRVWGSSSGLNKVQKELAKIKAKPIKKIKGEVDFISIVLNYQKFLRRLIDFKNLSDFKIVLDASGGGGARLAETIFAQLPLYSRRMNFYPNDEYPDHGLNPLLKGNWQSAAKEVKKFKADIGIVFDGDADRAIFIDERGEFVEPYYINCLLTKIILSRLKKGERILVDARLDLGIKEVAAKTGGVAVFHRSGYSNIIRTMQAKKIKFACENSGHFMFNFSLAKRGANFAFGDAILPALLVMQYLKKKKISLSKAISEFDKKYFISGEINMELKDFNRAKVSLRRHFSGRKFQQLDGLSVWSDHNKWFFNIRPSHTEPVVRINVEARDQKKLAELQKEIISVIK